MKDPILQEGERVLRQKARPIAKKDIGSRHLKGIISRMRAALKKEKFGVAIAAPQLGEPLRIFVVAGKALASQESSLRRDEHDPNSSAKTPATPSDKVFINPEIIRLSRKKKEMTEGCLSVRKKYGTVLRHEKATVRAQDEMGNSFIYHGTGLLAQIFQHECDHLDGVLYVDKAKEIHDEPEKER